MLVLDGSQGITYPVTAGSTSTLQAGSSKVLQVIQSSLTTSQSTAGGVLISSNLSASITPTSSTSKILIMVNGGKTYAAANSLLYCQMYRNGSTLGSSVSWVPIEIGGAQVGSAQHSFSYLDSPATTSSITYTPYYRNYGSTCYFLDYGATPAYGAVTLTLMEIAA